MKPLEIIKDNELDMDALQKNLTDIYKYLSTYNRILEATYEQTISDQLDSKISIQETVDGTLQYIALKRNGVTTYFYPSVPGPGWKMTSDKPV